MGTPDFAVASLEALVAHGFTVAGVVTAPDKPRGRGQKMSHTPVKTCALKHNLPVLQPEKLKDEAFLAQLDALNANLFVVVAFRMLPQVVWSRPQYGTFNLHGSKLPQYRGAAPINWAIMNGETETGLTTFFIKRKIDTGSMLFQESTPIYADDTAGTLHDRMMAQGAQLVAKTTQAIAHEQYTLTEQDEGQATKPAPKIFKEDCLIDWHRPTAQVYDFIRGLSPYPAAYTQLKGKALKVFKTSKMADTNTTLAPGEVSSDGKTYLHFATANGLLAIEELQLEGKKRMQVTDFLRGYAL